MRIRLRPGTFAVVALAVTGATAALLPAAAGAARPAVTPATTVTAVNGGYITTYAAANGDTMEVYAGAPVTVDAAAPTSEQVVVDGATVTQLSATVNIAPTGTLDKSAALPPLTVSPYDALITLGADPTDAATFDGGGTGAPPARVPLTNSGGGTQIGPPACAKGTFDGGHLTVYGCDVTRRVGTSGAVWYLTDAAQSSARMTDTGCVFCDHLTGLKFGVSYGSGNTVQSWKPAATNDVGSCVSDTVSLAFHGVGVSETAQQCPATFGLFNIGTNFFSTKWDGQGHGPNNGARATHAVDGVYNGASANPYPGVFFTVWWTTT